MRRLCGPLVAFVVLLSACSDDDGSSASQSPSASSPSDPETPLSDAISAPTDDLLRPNMRSLAASQLRVVEEEGERRLRFAGSLANLGPGPMVVRPGARGVCPPRQISVRQIVYRDTSGDGAFQRRRDPARLSRYAGCMLDHPTHDHWHFDAMARYTLRRAGSDQPLVSRDKVSFCLRDNRRVAGSPPVVRREHFGDCTRRGRQGISPGWVDVYSAELDGQSLRLPRGVNGRRLCLDLTADPLGVLVEADETDNGTTVGLRVRGDRVVRTGSARCR